MKDKFISSILTKSQLKRLRAFPFVIRNYIMQKRRAILQREERR